jgi:AhpD family alkylhydroperoxidase
MAFRPEVVGPLNGLVDVLLRSSDGISPGERELIATFVSSLNDCFYCQTTHGAVAAAHLGGAEDLVLEVKRRYQDAAISNKLRRCWQSPRWSRREARASRQNRWPLRGRKAPRTWKSTTRS